MRSIALRIPYRIYQLAVFFTFTAWQIFFLIHHELWRDEIQAWNIAKASNTPLNLLQNLKYEGRPPLWHLLLWILGKVTDSPSSMKILALLLSLGSAAALLSLKSFSRVEKILILAGFYFAFGYSVVARDYNLILLLQLVAMKNSEGTNFKAIKILAILLTLVNPFGAVLGLYWLMQCYVRENRDNLLNRVPLLRSCINVLLILAILFVFRMPSDSTFKPDFSKSISSAILLTGHSLISPFLPFHDSHTLNAKDLIIYAVVALLLIGSIAQISIRILLRYSFALVLLAANATFGYAAYWWHFGAGFLLLLAVIQENRLEENKRSLPKVHVSPKISNIALLIILSLGVAGTVIGTGTDFRPAKKYSNIEATGRSLQSVCRGCVIITNSAVFGTPLWAFGSQVFVAPEGEFEEFVTWRKNDASEVNWEKLISTAKEHETKFIVVSHFENPPAGKVKLLKEYKGSIWGDDYQIYTLLD